LAVTRELRRTPSSFNKAPVFDHKNKFDRYDRPATLGETIVPSGSTTIKNGFTGLVIRDRSERSPVLDKSPPNQIRCRTLGTATTIAATTRDIRKKVILSQVCTAYRADWMQDRFVVWTRKPIFIPFNIDERAQIIRTAFRDILCGEPRTGSIDETLPPKFVAAEWRRRP
jgi:hypothetical protein